MGFRVFGDGMLYIAYLDEFGHIGPYLSHDHPSHKTSPVFGLAGIVLPAQKVRQFATFFFQLKSRLLKWEISRANEHPARWEKKGSQLFTTKNVEKYSEVRKATNRILNWLQENGGYVFYVGLEKRRTEENQSSEALYKAVLQEAIKRLDSECQRQNNNLLIILDEQEDNFRAKIVEAAGYSMFGDTPCKTLIEPPIQAESHLYQTLQCADWICGLIGRLTAFHAEPEALKEFEWAEKFFGDRIKKASRRSSVRKLVQQTNYRVTPNIKKANTVD